MENITDINLKQLEQFMFHTEKIKKMSNNFLQIKEVAPHKIVKTKELTPKNNVVSESSNFFVPFQKDKLFWCFYVILFGMEVYESNLSHSFTIERKLRIESIEKMGTMSQKIKETKIKRADLENELLSNNDISLKSLYALCVIHSISLIIISGKKYYVFDFDSTAPNSDKCKIKNIIYKQPNGDFSICKSVSPDYISNLVDSLYLIENVNKPIKPPSAYLLTDLKELCNKMDIPTTDANGKQKTKNKLYEDVLLFIVS